ncbi:hypothetical protein JTE90_023971 [Oedothorax gibbosus]|uniref:Uncharacterized protein n=1 Tax=Oedothorax gibbosus TaxID=931172 RepID=A0AAV6UFT6_9ARAC|nr:hypothetical protein JTE90_023971 [Oedothorax gibbosus]
MANVNIDKSHPDYKFARDVTRYVIRDFYEACRWKPRGIFLEADEDSPFTTLIQMGVRGALQQTGAEGHALFDEDFASKSTLDLQEFKERCKKIKERFLKNVFSVRNFYGYCSMLCQYASIAYMYGIKNAPYVPFNLILQTLEYARKIGQFDDSTWKEMEDYSHEIK